MTDKGVAGVQHTGGSMSGKARMASELRYRGHTERLRKTEQEGS